MRASPTQSSRVTVGPVVRVVHRHSQQRLSEATPDAPFGAIGEALLRGANRRTTPGFRSYGSSIAASRRMQPKSTI